MQLRIPRLHVFFALSGKVLTINKTDHKAPIEYLTVFVNRTKICDKETAGKRAKSTSIRLRTGKISWRLLSSVWRPARSVATRQLSGMIAKDIDNEVLS